jgi:hypothetical protein
MKKVVRKTQRTREDAEDMKQSYMFSVYCNYFLSLSLLISRR